MMWRTFGFTVAHVKTTELWAGGLSLPLHFSDSNSPEPRRTPRAGRGLSSLPGRASRAVLTGLVLYPGWCIHRYVCPVECPDRKASSCLSDHGSRISPAPCQTPG